MDDGGPVIAECPGPCDLAFGDECADGRGRHRRSGLVDEEAPVGIPVEDEPQVGTVVDDRACGVDEVLGFQRVRFVVGEGAVEFGEEADDVEGHRGGSRVRAEDLPEEASGHAVSGVEHDRQSCDLIDVGEFADPCRVLLTHPGCRVLVLVDAPAVGLRCDDRELSDSRETRGQADAGGSGSADLDPVVVGRVVAGGDHGAGQVEDARGEVELVGRAQPQQHGLRSGGIDSGSEGVGESGRARSHIVADDHLGDCVDLGHRSSRRPAEGEQDVVVELIGNATADVIGADGGIEGSRPGASEFGVGGGLRCGNGPSRSRSGVIHESPMMRR